MSNDEILAAVQLARAIHARSPFWQRVYAWPQDVVDDSLTIEWLCQGKLPAPTGSVAAYLKRRLMSFPGSQQHLNTIQWNRLRALLRYVASISPPLASTGGAFDAVICKSKWTCLQAASYNCHLHFVSEADWAQAFAEGLLRGAAA